MYDESDYIMLSALQHYQFCPRQCALIHIEQQWAENRFTAEGNILHERVDSQKSERQGAVRIVRTLPICSRLHGLSGQADVVEFHDDGTIFPVEYKRGRPKKIIATKSSYAHRLYALRRCWMWKYCQVLCFMDRKSAEKRFCLILIYGR